MASTTNNFVCVDSSVLPNDRRRRARTAIAIVIGSIIGFGLGWLNGQRLALTKSPIKEYIRKLNDDEDVLSDIGELEDELYFGLPTSIESYSKSTNRAVPFRFVDSKEFYPTIFSHPEVLNYNQSAAQ